MELNVIVEKTGCFETLCSIKRLKDKLIDEMNLSKRSFFKRVIRNFEMES